MTTIMATQWQRNLICNTNIYRFVKPEMQTAHCKIVFVLFSYALRWCEGWKGDGSSPTKTGFSIIVISSQKVISCLPHCKATTEAAIVQSCTALYKRTEAGCLIYTSNIRPTTISSASTVLSIAMYTKTIYCSNEKVDVSGRAPHSCPCRFRQIPKRQANRWRRPECTDKADQLIFCYWCWLLV